MESCRRCAWWWDWTYTGRTLPQAAARSLHQSKAASRYHGHRWTWARPWTWIRLPTQGWGCRWQKTLGRRSSWTWSIAQGTDSQRRPPLVRHLLSCFSPDLSSPGLRSLLKSCRQGWRKTEPGRSKWQQTIGKLWWAWTKEKVTEGLRIAWDPRLAIQDRDHNDDYVGWHYDSIVHKIKPSLVRRVEHLPSDPRFLLA